MTEWLEHYRKEGVDHFIIIDNGSDSDDDGLSILRASTDVSLFVDNTKYAQLDLYKKYIQPFLDQTTWIAIVDLDEFMYAKRKGSILSSELASLPSTVGMVTIRWTMFGSSGHVMQPRSVIRGFTYKQRHVHVNIKAIVRACAIKNLGQHGCELNPGFLTVDEYLDRAEGSPCLQLNHYAIQSWTFFERVKMTRGDVLSSVSEHVRDLNYFKAYDINEIEDDELAHKEYSEIDDD